MRGIDGPVRSISRIPTLASGEEGYSVRASCAATEDFPTPPFPEQIMMMRLMQFKRRDTGESCTAVIEEGRACRVGDQSRARAYPSRSIIIFRAPITHT